jgi:hypothetical protein
MSSFLALNDPLAQPGYFLGLEVVFLLCAGLTLRHALGRARAGDRFALFQWLAVWAYGVLMELCAFTFLDNYTHAQFTVQLYHRKLPLYVMCVYPVFLYTGLKLVERWRLPALPEALLAGFAICLLDVPFDFVGVRAGWWTWSSRDPNLAVRWLGVPVTSFEWYLLFGAVWALISRALRPRLGGRGVGVWLIAAPLVGAAIIVLGCVSFLPFHLLKALGLRDDLFVAAHLVGCALLLAATRPRAVGRTPGTLGAIPLVLVTWHAVVLAVLPSSAVPARAVVYALIAAAAVALAHITNTGALRAATPVAGSQESPR